MIDIIILTKDHIEDTKKCIESIKTKYPYKLIVVDSGSTDGTQEYAKSKGAMVIPTAGKFVFARNVNIGVKFGSNPLKLICNNDIEFTGEAIDAMVEQLPGPNRPEISVNIGMVGPYSNGVMNPDQKSEVTVAKDTTRTLNFFCVLIHDEVFNKIGYLDKQFTGYGCEDDDFCIRYLLAGGRMRIAPAFVAHRCTATYKEMDKKPMFKYNKKRFRRKWKTLPAQDWGKQLDLLNKVSQDRDKRK